MSKKMYLYNKLALLIHHLLGENYSQAKFNCKFFYLSFAKIISNALLTLEERYYQGVILPKAFYVKVFFSENNEVFI